MPTRHRLLSRYTLDNNISWFHNLGLCSSSFAAMVAANVFGKDEATAAAAVELARDEDSSFLRFSQGDSSQPPGVLLRQASGVSSA